MSRQAEGEEVTVLAKVIVQLPIPGDVWLLGLDEWFVAAVAALLILLAIWKWPKLL